MRWAGARFGVGTHQVYDEVAVEVILKDALPDSSEASYLLMTVLAPEEASTVRNSAPKRRCAVHIGCEVVCSG